MPQLPDSELVPRPGIRLIKENTVFEPVGAAEFRVEDIKFDKIFQGLEKFTNKIPLESKMKIMSSWENLRKTLESLPRRITTLRKLKLEDLPKLRIPDQAPVPDYLRDRVNENTLSGDVYPEVIEEGDLKEIDIGTDVCVYTESLRGRPWVGRVTKVFENQILEIQWFVRKSGRGKIFEAMKDASGNPALSEVHLDSVMFWRMSEQRNEETFTL